MTRPSDQVHAQGPDQHPYANRRGQASLVPRQGDGMSSRQYFRYHRRFCRKREPCPAQLLDPHEEEFLRDRGINPFTQNFVAQVATSGAFSVSADWTLFFSVVCMVGSSSSEQPSPNKLRHKAKTTNFSVFITLPLRRGEFHIASIACPTSNLCANYIGRVFYSYDSYFAPCWRVKWRLDTPAVSDPRTKVSVGENNSYTSLP